MRMSSLGMKAKVVLACVSIGMILSLSAIIAFFEFGRMSDYVSGMIADNIASVNLSRLMLNNTDEYNTYILHQLNDDTFDVLKFDSRRTKSKEEFYGYLHESYEHFTTEKEQALADSVARAYASYMLALRDLDELWPDSYEARKNWYFGILQPYFEVQRDYIQRLTHTSQNALAENYSNIEDNYYRSVMPGVVAVIAGIILLILFYYFLNFYILSPLVKMNKELKKYKDYNKTYDVDVHIDSGQVSQLNQYIKEIVAENKKLKRK